jgi:hypothetical protein
VYNYFLCSSGLKEKYLKICFKNWSVFAFFLVRFLFSVLIKEAGNGEMSVGHLQATGRPDKGSAVLKVYRKYRPMSFGDKMKKGEEKKRKGKEKGRKKEKG